MSMQQIMFASLAAGGDSFDDQVLMDDHDTPDYPSFAVDSSIAPTITSLHNTVSAFTRMALRDRVTVLRLWSPKLNVGSRVPEASMSLSFYLLKTSGSQFVVG